jgi:protein-S-isoprenylcysteine O-methyltransferase Ste14
MTEREQAFKVGFFALFLAVMATRAYYGWKIRRAGRSSWAVEEEAVQREGRWSVLLRLILFLYMLAVVALYALNPAWMGACTLPLPDWSRWLGAGLGLAGLFLLIWVQHTLGGQWSTNLQLVEGHSLITSGPYRWARHPMYTALFSYFVGAALLSANWLIVVLVVVAILVLYRRIGEEEAMMIEQFGDEYRVYMQGTGRFLPRLRPQGGDES